MEEKKKIEMKCKKEVLNKIFTRAKPFVNEIILNINKEGIDGRIIDNAHVALYEGTIGKEKFDDYQITSEEKIGIDLNQIDIPLSLVNEDMEIEYIEYDRKLKINNYRLSLIDTTGITPVKIPNIEHTIEIKTDKSEFLKKLFSVAGKISDHVEFYIGEDKKLWIRGKGTKGPSDDFAEPIGETIELMPTKYPVTAKFSVDVLSNVFKDLKDEVTISIKKDEPIKIVEEKENEKHLFLIAPRIDVE
jgi:DNA polymerase III sliding clamp (beta) subunit (PCNA family)